MKFSTCFLLAGLAGLASASIAPLNNHAAGLEAAALEKRRALLRTSSAKAAPAPAPKKKVSKTPKKAPAKAPAAKAPAAKPAKAPATKPPAAKAPAAKPPAAKAPAPAPVAPAPGPVVVAPTTNYSGALSTIQQLQLAAITERAQQTLVTTGTNMFSDADFAAAGYQPKIRMRILNFLNSNTEYLPKYASALGAKLPGNCTYSFPIGSPQDLVALAKIVEQAGHNARFQPAVTPVLVGDGYSWVPRINYAIKSGVLSNTIAQYIVSCPTPMDGGIVLRPPPLLTVAAGAKPALGKSLAMTMPSGVNLDMNHAFVHLISGDQHIVQNVSLSGSTLTVTIPPQGKADTKGLTFISVINNPDTGTYSGPSDTNLYTGSVPVNAIGEVCKAPFAC